MTDRRTAREAGHSPADLDEQARRLVADWPPLSDAQRARVSALLSAVRPAARHDPDPAATRAG